MMASGECALGPDDHITNIWPNFSLSLRHRQAPTTATTLRCTHNQNYRNTKMQKYKYKMQKCINLRHRKAPPTAITPSLLHLCCEHSALYCVLAIRLSLSTPKPPSNLCLLFSGTLPIYVHSCFRVGVAQLVFFSGTFCNLCIKFFGVSICIEIAH